jgi:hypothetical protein
MKSTDWRACHNLIIGCHARLSANLVKTVYKSGSYVLDTAPFTLASDAQPLRLLRDTDIASPSAYTGA